MSWSGQSVGSSLGTRFLLLLVSLFGYYPAYLFLPFISIFYVFIGKESTKALKEYYVQLGVTPSFIVLWNHYYSYALSFLHRTVFYRLGPKGLKLVTIGEDMLAELTQSSGVILLSAHVGGWEIGGNLLVDRIDTPVNILAADRDVGALAGINNELNANRKVSLISVDQDPLAVSMAIREALGRKEIVAALGDRFVAGQGEVEIDFFGKPAQFPRGIFEVAMIAKVPIVPVFTTRTSLNTYTFKASTPLWITPQSRQERKNVIEKSIQGYVGELEKVVRLAPNQWYNFYSFWNAR